MNAAGAGSPRLLVVGGGFAGLWAIRALAGEVATAGLSAPDIAAPLRHILRRQRNVEVLLGEVVRIDKEARQAELADGRRLGFDCLLLASGATHAYFGHDEWAAHAPGLKTLDDALKLRRRLLAGVRARRGRTRPVAARGLA
jgi:NADH dehydrogenase